MQLLCRFYAAGHVCVKHAAFILFAREGYREKVCRTHGKLGKVPLLEQSRAEESPCRLAAMSIR